MKTTIRSYDAAFRFVFKLIQNVSSRINR